MVTISGCALLQYTRWGPGHSYLSIYVRTYCTCALVKCATYSFHGTPACFQTFGHDVLNIVHVLIGGFVICVERCSTMRCLAGTAQYLLNCVMRANNGL